MAFSLACFTSKYFGLVSCHVKKIVPGQVVSLNGTLESCRKNTGERKHAVMEEFNMSPSELLKTEITPSTS